MKKKKDEFYYKNLNTCVEYSYEAAGLLQDTVKQYAKESLQERIAQMHEIEQQADFKKHKMMSVVSQAFITPIEREDLVALSNYLDDITDAVEDVLLQIYMCNIDEMREDILPMIKLLKKCIQALGDVIGELKNFKHSKKLAEYIIKVNDLEEQGDKLYMEAMHRLHQESDIRTIMIWRNIYECVEVCMDTCEHAADIVETVRMKNV
ncbi:MAG: DUF47 family protein [Lachnospiraceae bacterium]|nr:DUF47 family protein [Lachnospiraceae bacterium]